MYLISLICIVLLVNVSYCFIPAQIMKYVVETFDSQSKLDFGEISETLAHEDIMKYGTLRAAARYFYNQTNGSLKINLNKLDTDYRNVQLLYKDYYGKNLCKFPFANIIEDDLLPNVAIVDFDSQTKDLPYAHFDAETFLESNQRVVDFTNRILNSLNTNDYVQARKLSGQVMHTIQDFYSHSNWVEMNQTKINMAIGTPNFGALQIVGKTQNLTCLDNCSLVETQCGTISHLFVSFLNLLPIHKPANLQCPLKYYVCSNNLAVNDKLVSGFYGGQKLEDGTSIHKPDNLIKCGHGGFLDSDSSKPAIGGINKDSGIYLFSPHANLHLVAAQLAIEHTDYFFTQIRQNISDEKFNSFLNLTISDDLLNKNYYTCSGVQVLPQHLFSALFGILSFYCNFLILSSLF